MQNSAKSLFVCAVLAIGLVGCATHRSPDVSPQVSASVAGPVVSGKLKDDVAVSQIPFSSYTTGSPVIATEAWVQTNALSSTVPSTLMTSGAPGTKLQIGRYLTGQGHSGAETTLSANTQYITLGGLEYGGSSIRAIGFGYTPSGSASPAALLYREVGTTGSTNGSVCIATRSVTTSTAPIDRFCVQPDGQLYATNTYVPTMAYSLATKSYVDAQVAALQTKIDALTAALATKANGSVGTTRPPFGHPGTVGYEFWDLSVGAPLWWDGSQWIHADGNP